MAKSASGKYQGSLTLEWFNKQKAVLLLDGAAPKKETDVPAPRINWINRDDALFYEIDEKEGLGVTPYWVDRNDIRVKEARPLVFQKSFAAEARDKKGTLPGLDIEYKVRESNGDEPDIQNWLIKGDNLLALNALKRHFDKLPDEKKVKCIYIDPPFNTENAFEHYDDNFSHSEWLTLMRDRLVVLKDLLSTDGSIFIHIDDNEVGYLTVLADEVFGRENRIFFVTFKQGSATGHKAINPGCVNTSNFVICWAKNKELWKEANKDNRVFVEKSSGRDPRYDQFITNYEKGYEHWEFVPLAQAFAKNNGVNPQDAKKQIDNYSAKLDQFVFENKHRVIQFARPDYDSVSEEAREYIDKSIKTPDRIFLLKRAGYSDMYFVRGKRIIFFEGTLKQIDGKLVPGEALSTIWLDLLSNNIHNEGGVDFPKGKKPESLIRRVLELSTREDDLVLDCFAGSGTTCAVAHKMKRRWICVEIGLHAKTHIIPRLKKVLDGEDQGGISKATDWTGGGAFKYYHLGPSIINVDAETGKGEFNWSLGREFLQESLLQSYDFIPDNSISFKQDMNGGSPLFGRLESAKGVILGVAWLGTPDEPDISIDAETVQALYSVLKQHKPISIHVFTNKGMDIKQETMPQDLEIIKVPHAIFANLER
jgi:adenine-specific DNA-methyltransferase